MNAKNVLNYASDQEARFISVRFTDLVGAWHHLSFPIDQLTEDSFEDGFGFDALNDAESVVWVNDLVTNLECHASPTTEGECR